MTKTIAVKLTVSAEREVKKGHPWVFSKSILKVNKEAKSGDIAVLFDRQTNKPFAIGLYDAQSPIQIKIIHHDGPAQINEEFFRKRIEQSFLLREPLLKTNTNGYRLIFGENDNFPGLIVDVYNEIAVVKLYTTIWLPYLSILVPLIVEYSNCATVVARLSRKLQDLPLEIKEGDVLFGELPESTTIFSEYGIRFKVDVIHGHKTGFFLDHRANRKRIGEYSKGKTVLDVFSYAGGFSVHALAGGAKEVTSVDFSQQALELAKENAKLNQAKGTHNTIQGDAFEILENMVKERTKFDIVMIDPPSFAKSKTEIARAKIKYAELAELGVKITNSNGILLLASCSSRVTKEEFQEIHKQVFNRMGVRYSLLEASQHDIDHPIRFEEGAYLKSFYYQIHS